MDLKAALFRKQQEYKKEKSSSLHVESAPASSTVAAAQTAVEKAGRKVSDKVSVRCPEVFNSSPVVITPRACTRGKVIGRIVIVVIVSRKVAISRDLGT